MNTLIDFILSLFRSEQLARDFVAGPGQALTNAGLVNVAPEQFALAAANALPGLALGGGDPMWAVQQAVADQYGFAPSLVSAYAPSIVDPGYGYGGYGPGYGYGP